jgi:hypothetical protein
MDADYSDNPISKPEEDMLGIDGFVQSLARSVRTMRSPSGAVIALTSGLRHNHEPFIHIC